MKLRVILLSLIFVILSKLSVQGQDPCVIGRVEVNPEYEQGVLRADVPFRINVYLEQITGSSLPGFSFVLRFHGENGVSEVTHVEAVVYPHCCSNVIINPLMEYYFNLFSGCTCVNWDAALPDTFAYAGGGTTGWPAATGEELIFSFEFIIDQEGTFCVDTAYLDPIGDPIWECFTQIDVPYCWEVVDAPGVCGDTNGDGKINILDGVFVIRYLYFNGPVPYPIKNADINGDGKINLLDVVYLIKYLYLDGSALNCP